MSKRVKISFDTINKGLHEVIPNDVIARENRIIKEAITPKIKVFKEKEWKSLQISGYKYFI